MNRAEDQNGLRKVLLKNSLSPGDIITLTAAVRDLHLTHPGRFLTDVRTSCSALWENNPYITHLEENDALVEQIQCHYPLINRCNQAPYHMIHGFRLFLEETLGVNIEPHAFRGDIHLSELEKSWMSQVEEIEGLGARFWIIVSGGKRDYTAKWWDPDRAQQVVDHFSGRIRFAQCGEVGHHHPRLNNVIDLVGKTDLRQIVRLMWHAEGVVCPVTMFMHLAAALDTKPGKPKNRPCVVIAGGREPSHWEAYPHHQFLHTNGALPCCDHGGCWKSRVEPLGDGDPKDGSLCLMPIALPSGRKLPKCLDMITARDVIAAVENYLEFYGASERHNGKRPAAVASVQPVSNLLPNPPSPVEMKATMKTSVTREQMEAFARGWQSAEKNKLLSPAELKELHARFVADDERGTTWTVGVRSLRWHRLEAGQWVPGDAPGRLLLDQQVLVRLGQLLPAGPASAAGATPAMKCSSCGAALQPIHKFCISCGTPVKSNPTRTCPQCGTVTSGREKFCGSCGAQISPVPPTPLPQPTQERRCPACRHVVPPEFKFCTACGTRV